MIMGCHQMPSRCLYYKGRPMVVCARCTGQIIGFFSGFVIVFFLPASFLFVLALLAPMIIDGVIQRLTPYESHNIMRLLTGFIGGVGINMIFYLLAEMTVTWLIL